MPQIHPRPERKLFATAIWGALVLTLAASGADARGGGRVGGGGMHASGGFQASGGFSGGRGAATNIQRPGGGGGGTYHGNGNFNHNGNFNNNTNINRNVNANVNRNVNVDVDNHWNGGACYGGCRGWGYNHPVAAGVAIGTAAAVTAAAIGSMVYSLPPSCAPRVYPSGTYYGCGDVWYQPQYSGTSVTYVVVKNPG